MNFSFRLIAILMTLAALLATMTTSMRECAKEERVVWENPLDPPDIASGIVPRVPNVTRELEEAFANNPDVVGWLQVPGTPISEPVYQSDDNIFYNRRDGNKNYSYAGSVYLDYECTVEKRLSQNMILYAHNLGYPWGKKDAPDRPESGKFGPLLKFDDISFAREHPYFYFTTPQRDYIYQIFAVLYTEADIRPLPYILPAYSDDDFASLISDMRSRSQFNYPITVGENDKVMTLSTCTHKYGTYEQNPDQRFVVMGRLVRRGERIYPTARVSVNPAPKEPDFQKNWEMDI